MLCEASRSAAVKLLWLWAGEWGRHSVARPGVHHEDDHNGHGCVPRHAERCELRTAKNAKQPAVAPLSTIYSRQQADSDLLQRLELLWSEILWCRSVHGMARNRIRGGVKALHPLVLIARTHLSQ